MNEKLTITPQTEIATAPVAEMEPVVAPIVEETVAVETAPAAIEAPAVEAVAPVESVELATFELPALPELEPVAEVTAEPAVELPVAADVAPLESEAPVAVEAPAAEVAPAATVDVVAEPVAEAEVPNVLEQARQVIDTEAMKIANTEPELLTTPEMSEAAVNPSQPIADAAPVATEAPAVPESLTAEPEPVAMVITPAQPEKVGLGARIAKLFKRK